MIEAVGPPGPRRFPADARMIDLTGKVVHAAFIDPYVPRIGSRASAARPADDEEGEPAPERRRGPSRRTATGAPDPRIRGPRVDHSPSRSVSRSPTAASDSAWWRRSVRGILRGAGAVVSLADGAIGDRVLRGRDRPVRFARSRPAPTARLFVARLLPRVEDGRRGAVTRKGLLDALWWRDAEAAYARNPAGPGAAASGRLRGGSRPGGGGEGVPSSSRRPRSCRSCGRDDRAGVQADSPVRRRGRRVPPPRADRRDASGPDPARSTFRGRTGSTTTTSGWTSASTVCAGWTARPRIRSGSTKRVSFSR